MSWNPAFWFAAGEPGKPKRLRRALAKKQHMD
jgi:hypothetical protein